MVICVVVMVQDEALSCVKTQLFCDLVRFMKEYRKEHRKTKRINVCELIEMFLKEDNKGIILKFDLIHHFITTEMCRMLVKAKNENLHSKLAILECIGHCDRTMLDQLELLHCQDDEQIKKFGDRYLVVKKSTIKSISPPDLINALMFAERKIRLSIHYNRLSLNIKDNGFFDDFVREEDSRFQASAWKKRMETVDIMEVDIPTSTKAFLLPYFIEESVPMTAATVPKPRTQEVTFHPEVSTINVTGGFSIHTLSNNSKYHVAYKFFYKQCSNYSVSKACGMIEKGGNVQIKLTKCAGKSISERMTIKFKYCDDPKMDPNKAFGQGRRPSGWIDVKFG